MNDTKFQWHYFRFGLFVPEVNPIFYSVANRTFKVKICQPIGRRHFLDNTSQSIIANLLTRIIWAQCLQMVPKWKQYQQNKHILSAFGIDTFSCYLPNGMYTNTYDGVERWYYFFHILFAVGSVDGTENNILCIYIYIILFSSQRDIVVPTRNCFLGICPVCVRVYMNIKYW